MNPKDDKFFKSALLAVVAVYFVLAQVAQFNGGFMIPNFDVSIGSNKPDETAGYVIQFIELDGMFLDAPQQIERVIESRGGEFTWSVENLIKQLGIAHHEGDLEAVKTFRMELELLLAGVGVDSAEYQLIWRVVNPVERFTLDSFEVDEVLATFSYQPG